MSKAVEGRRFAHEELRKEVNGVMASEAGQAFKMMFARAAEAASYPFPSLDLLDGTADEYPTSSDKQDSAIRDLLSALEETAMSAQAPNG